ncbi:MAG: hypothetical protein M0Z31_13285 [Clostridia bacterium]|nr:hypothetical protein [Clostridia bacterium]
MDSLHILSLQRKRSSLFNAILIVTFGIYGVLLSFGLSMRDFSLFLTVLMILGIIAEKPDKQGYTRKIYRSNPEQLHGYARQSWLVGLVLGSVTLFIIFVLMILTVFLEFNK